MDDDSKMSFFFLGLGLAVGVLFAPKSGSETREFLMSKANETAEQAKQRAKELREQAADTIERGRAAAAETIERGKTTVQRHKESVVAAVDAGRQAYRETVNQPIPE